MMMDSILNVSFQTGPPAYLRIWITLPSPYLKVWICYILVKSFKENPGQGHYAGTPVGYSRFQVTGMIEGILGFEIFDFGIFWVGKFSQVFFWVASYYFKYGFFGVFITIWRLKNESEEWSSQWIFQALIFFQASSFQLLELENSLRWSFFTFIYNRSSNMNSFHILHIQSEDWC